MTHQEIIDLTRDFMKKRFPLFVRKKLSDKDSLLETGVVDSLGILEIVSFVESEFNPGLSDEDIVANNFNSVESISRLVSDRLASPSK